MPRGASKERFDIAAVASREFAFTEVEWALVQPRLKLTSGPGRPNRYARQHLEGMIHLALAEEPWCRLPARYGKANSVARTFRRWNERGVIERLLHAFPKHGPSEPDLDCAPLALHHWLNKLAASRLQRSKGRSQSICPKRRPITPREKFKNPHPLGI